MIEIYSHRAPNTKLVGKNATSRKGCTHPAIAFGKGNPAAGGGGAQSV